MPAFPVLLKTGAIAQYPLQRNSSRTTHAVRFLDGSRQTCSLSGGGLRTWVIHLDLLDESELTAVIAFAEQTGSGTFSFTDPVTGETAAKCVIGDAELLTELRDEMRGTAILGIEEVK